MRLEELLNVAAEVFRSGHPYNSVRLAELLNMSAEVFRGGHP